MADDVEENDDEHWSEAMAESPSERKPSKDPSAQKLSLADVSEPQLTVESNTEIYQSSSEYDATLNNQIKPQATNENAKQFDVREKNPTTNNRRKQPRSECRARSQNVRQCQQRFREMIEKQEMRNEELEQVEGDLRQRLEKLECSVPAVMAWNIWRMARASPTTAVRRLIEKQLECYDGDKADLPMTPSRHWDERVRKIEAERKEAVRRSEEAKAILAKKESAIEERRKQVEEAKKCNREMKEQLEKLAREAAELGVTPKLPKVNDDTCGTCECSEGRGKDKWLDDASSSGSSMGSVDLECFGNLRELAEAEVCMKRKIRELERREEAYMMTLQQADEMWSKMEGDTTDEVTELKVKLDSKTAANQQLADRICQLEDELESSKNRLIRCNDALSEFRGKEYVEVGSGLDDGEATVKNRGVAAAVKTNAASVVATPTTVDQESSIRPQTTDQESNVVATERADAGINAVSKRFDKGTEATTVGDRVDRGADAATGLGIDVSLGDDKDISENWNWDENGCPPSVVCDDLVESSTGTDDDPPQGVPTNESNVQAVPEMVERPVGRHTVEDKANYIVDVQIQRTDENAQTNNPSIATGVATEASETMLDTEQVVLRREELKNWYNIVNSVYHVIAKCANCSPTADDTAQLAEKIKLHLRIKGVAGVTGSIIIDVIRKESLIAAEVHESTSPTPSAGQMSRGTESAVLTDRHSLPDETEAHTLTEIATIDTKTSSFSAEIRQLSQSEIPEIKQIPIEEEVGHDVSEDFGIPEVMAETTDISTAPVSLETESDLPDKLEEISDTAETQIELPEKSEMVLVDPRLSISVEETSEDEKSSKDEIADDLPNVEIQHQPAEMSHANIFTEATIESPKKSEDVISLSNTTKVQSEAFTDVSRKISPVESLPAPDEDFDESVVSVSFAHADEPAAVTEPEKQPTQLSDDDTSIAISKEFVEETEDKISIFQDEETEFEDAVEMPDESFEFLSKQNEVESLIEPEIFSMPIENEELISDETAEEEATIDETPSSFVTLRTPTPSKIHVEPESKAAILSAVTSEYEPPSDLDLIDEMPSFEIIVDEQLVAGLSAESHDPQDTERIPESLAPISEPVESEGVEIKKVSTTIAPDEISSPMMESRESIHLETGNLEIRTDEGKADFETKPETHEARSHGDAKETEQPADKLVGDIPGGKKIIAADRVKVGKPYLAIAKVESSINLELPESLGPCTCKPRTCPLLGRSGVGKPKRKVPRVGGEITQTTPVTNEIRRGRTDEPKPRTISKRTWPSPEAEMWRRATIWSRRPGDKSGVTTVCVDTQTDSALARERMTLEGIDRTRKNDYTCSGVRPKKMEDGGCVQRIPNRPPGEKVAPAGLGVDKLFGGENFPTSVTPSVKKETAVERYTVRSPVPGNGGTRCDECGRPITPEGTLLSAASTLSTRPKTQNGIMSCLQKLTGTISAVPDKKDNSKCCECKKSDKPETEIGSRHGRRNETSCDGAACCPCPSGAVKKRSSKSSRKKRRPETKDQAVMARIPRSTAKASAKHATDADVSRGTSLNDTPSRSKFNESDMKITSEAPSPDVISYCVCEESSNDASIAEGNGVGNFAADRTLKGRVSCDCLLKDSVSKGSSCNCTEDTK